MKLPLPASIKGLVTVIVLLALLPALALIALTTLGKARNDLQVLSREALLAAGGIAARQTRLMENTRTLLLTLSRLDEVRGKKLKACSLLFQNLVLHAPYYANIRLCDVRGEVLASADPAPLSEFERRQLLEAMGSGAFSVHEPQRGQSRDAPVLLCQYPVEDERGITGALAASVVIGIEPSELGGLAARHVEHMHIVDRNGAVLFSSSPGERDGPDQARDREDDWHKIAAMPERSGVFRGSGGNFTAFEKIGQRGGDAPALTMVLTISTDVVYDRLRERLRDCLALLAGALCVALFVTLRLCSLNLIRPAHILLDAAQRIKNGDLSPRGGKEAMTREFRLLADSLDSLADALAARDRELLAASGAANAASQAKTDFLANMSHEIRTPMNAILGMTYLARQGELTEQQRGYLDTIQAEAGKLLVVINDILDFSKIEAGKFQIEQAPFDLSRVLEEVRAAADEQARRACLSFSADFAPDLPVLLRGDAAHFSQVLINVLGNAVKVTKKGGIGLAVSVLRDGKSSRVTLECRVSDSAGGFEPGEAALYFPEQEPEGGVTPLADQGAGLNLAVTRRLLHLMQGDYAVESEPGVGSVVILRLPFTEIAALSPESGEELAAPPSGGEAPPAIAGRDAPEAQAPPAADLRRLRILLVEDNPVNRQIAEEILTAEGALVSTASNGLEAVALFTGAPSGAPFDLVLMDLQMPELDGLAATRRIRLDERFARLPIIAMTAQSQSEEWAECREAGMDDFVSKPLDVPVFLATLRKWAGRGRRK